MLAVVANSIAVFIYRITVSGVKGGWSNRKSLHFANKNERSFCSAYRSLVNWNKSLKYE